MSVQSNHHIDYGDFCVWKYNGPGKKARGFWHGDDPVLVPLWAYALRSPMPGDPSSSFWQTSRAKGGFASEEAAASAARAVVSERKAGAA